MITSHTDLKNDTIQIYDSRVINIIYYIYINIIYYE